MIIGSRRRRRAWHGAAIRTQASRSAIWTATELTPSVEGYFAQICRTLVLGKASEMQKKAFAVYHEAMEAGIAAVKPGVTAGDVARAENDVFRKHGLGDYVTNKYTRVRGHGLGLMCDLKPNILEEIDVELKPGMTISCIPTPIIPRQAISCSATCLL